MARGRDPYVCPGTDVPTNELGLGDATDPFCRAQFIDTRLSKRFEAIRSDDGLLQGATVRQFAERAAEHLAEINAIHPFREGYVIADALVQSGGVGAS